jgi:hypothetical protein
MSTSLFGKDGDTYNQTAVLDSDNRLDRTILEEFGLPRYTTTYAISQLCYNLSVGAAVVSVTLWRWDDLKRGISGDLNLKLTNDRQSAFGSISFFKGDGGAVDDPHYQGIYSV